MSQSDENQPFIVTDETQCSFQLEDTNKFRLMFTNIQPNILRVKIASKCTVCKH